MTHPPAGGSDFRIAVLGPIRRHALLIPFEHRNNACVVYAVQFPNTGREFRSTITMAVPYNLSSPRRRPFPPFWKPSVPRTKLSNLFPDQFATTEDFLSFLRDSDTGPGGGGKCFSLNTRDRTTLKVPPKRKTVKYAIITRISSNVLVYPTTNLPEDGFRIECSIPFRYASSNDLRIRNARAHDSGHFDARWSFRGLSLNVATLSPMTFRIDARLPRRPNERIVSVVSIFVRS